jgi:hypothetical protein
MYALSRSLMLLGAAALLGVLHLWLTVGWSVVSPSNPLWHPPQGDTMQAVLGAEAFLRDPAWHVPLGLTSKLLSGAQPVSIVYTDSAPWIAILAKAAGLGAGDVSVIGLTAVLSVVLQPVAFALLLLAMGVRRAEVVLIGTILGSLLPAWYVRTAWHVALSSHWLIVLALAAAAVAIRRGVSRAVIAALAALGAFSIGIHAYLFTMVAAVAAGALLADVASTGRRALPRAAAGAAAFLACSVLSAWVLGYGPSGGGGGFGFFSMNLLSPFVPQHSGLRAALTGHAGEFLDATGGEYEGFNYLGAGILAVLAAGIVVACRRGIPHRLRRAAAPLGAALLVLTLLALSNKVFAGSACLLDIKLPPALDLRLAQVRSSGRLFWPVAYAGLAWALLALDRSSHRRSAGLLLVSALLLQVADTSVVRRSLADEYAPLPKAGIIDPTSWDQAFAGRDLRFLPSFSCASGEDYPFVRHAALVAERAGGAVTGGPIARFDKTICARERFDAASPGRGGEQVDLILRRSVSPATLALAVRSGRCAALWESVACGAPALAAVRSGTLPPATAPSLPSLAPGEPMYFTGTAPGTTLLGPGWLPPEAFQTWTLDERSLLLLPLPPGWTGDATFVVDATAYGASPFRLQQVTILAEGHAVAQWLVPFGKFGRFTVRVPASALRDGSALLDLVVPHPLMLNKAGRVKRPAHGFGLQSVTLLPPQG